MTISRQKKGARGEPVFRILARNLFREGLIPDGSVLDAGSNTGVEACMYASFDRKRTVHALDPLQVNIDHILAVHTNRLVTNLQPMVGGL